MGYHVACQPSLHGVGLTWGSKLEIPLSGNVIDQVSLMHLDQPQLRVRFGRDRLVTSPARPRSDVPELRVEGFPHPLVLAPAPATASDAVLVREQVDDFKAVGWRWIDLRVVIHFHEKDALQA